MLGFLGFYGNSKDTLEARWDLKDIHRNKAALKEIDEEADPEKVEEEEQDYLGPASYSLSNEKGHHV
jgi:hypothetical protein